MASELIYDPRYHSWDSWASLMCELYAAQQLSIPTGEDQWRQWAMGLKGIDTFAKEDVPDPYGFAQWYEWVEVLMDSVSPTNRPD